MPCWYDREARRCGSSGSPSGRVAGSGRRRAIVVHRRARMRSGWRLYPRRRAPRRWERHCVTALARRTERDGRDPTDAARRRCINLTTAAWCDIFPRSVCFHAMTAATMNATPLTMGRMTPGSPRLSDKCICDSRVLYGIEGCRRVRRQAPPRSSEKRY